MYFALHKLKIRPSEFLDMSDEEKAFIIASIDIYKEERLEQEKKLKSKK